MSDQTPQNHPNDQAAGHDGLPGVYLFPPWATYADDSNAYRAPQQHAHPGRLKQQAETERKFIEDRSRVHATYIQEVEKTMRLSLVIVAVCVAAACLVLVFAPDGREHVAYGVSAALALFAAGIAGFHKFSMKAPLTSFEAGQNTKDAPDSKLAAKR